MEITMKPALVFTAVMFLLIIGYSVYLPTVSGPTSTYCNAASDCKFTNQAWVLANDTTTNSCCLNEVFLDNATAALNRNGMNVMFSCTAVNCECIEHTCAVPQPTNSS